MGAKHACVSVGLVLLLSACATTRDTQPASATGASGSAPAANDKLDAVAWTQGAAEFRALSLQAFAAATRTLEAARLDPGWDALPPDERDALGNRDRLASLPLAVIADVDETLLDNTPFNVRLLLDPIDGAMSPDAARAEFSRRWHVWVAEDKADALPGAAEFARRLDAMGVAFFYVTNRDDVDRDATCRTLLAEGFPLPHCETFVLTRNPEDGRPSAKLSRRARVGSGHRVLLVFGDNLGDFIDGADATRPQRDAQVDRSAAWWGERWWMLPNPIYGSWELAAGPLPSTPSSRTSAGREVLVRAAKLNGMDPKLDK